MPACTTCNAQDAALKCRGCSACQPPNNIKYYCNKACQKADWRNHKENCLLTRTWALLPHFDVFSDSLINGGPAFTMLAQHRGFFKLPKNVRIDLDEYLNSVLPEARTQYLSGTSYMKPLDYATDYWNGNKEEYMRKWEDRVPKEMRDLCYTDDEYKVPLHYRPVKDVTDGEGRVHRMVEHFPHDFEVLSFEEFRRLWGDKSRAFLDPWARSRTPEGMGETVRVRDGA